jgi:monooxygenase
MSSVEHVDVLIVGAGLSGIGAAVHLQSECPGKRYAIVEARERIGGTWDLFRYPGIRSDSDMYTLGYDFKPWKDAKAIADGPAILNYIKETAREHGVERHIRTGHKVVGAHWSSANARWTVDIERSASQDRIQISCAFLFMCSGYYSYDQGHDPAFAGRADFQGQIVHPQFWPEQLDYAGKQVVIIGSGATAVTLLPEMAKQAAHVTMLQRSPTYMIARPARDFIANALRAVLPLRWAYALTRWKNVLFGMYFFNLCRRKPGKVRDWLLEQVKKELGSAYQEADFSPRYNPWDQRLCLVPDADLFDAMKAGKASIKTATIDRFVSDGVQLTSGDTLKADIIVTATGLKLQALAGVPFSVDGQRVEINKTLNYKGMMYSDVPNLASSFGYTNASWTLKCDLTCHYVCRLLNHMDATGTQIATPRNLDPAVTEEPWIDFSSGYVVRALADLPKQGSKHPWKLYQNYVRDLMMFRYGRVEDGVMQFSRAASADETSADDKVSVAA